MNILIAYTTFSSGTQTASQTVEEVLLTHQHTVTRKRITEVTFEDFSGFDLIILATPSWEHDGKDGQPHPDFADFIQNSTGKRADGKKFAVFGLGDSTYARFCGGVTHLVEFVESVGGELVGEPLRIDGFYFEEEKNTQLLVEWTENINSLFKT